MKIIGVFLLIFLYILLMPFLIVGLCMATYRQLWTSRQLGASATGLDVMNSRVIMHLLGQREDPYSVRLLGTLANVSHFGVLVSLYPTVLAYRLTGYIAGFASTPPKGHETIATFMYPRCTFFDTIFNKHLESMEQVVFMGAGYDTRAQLLCQDRGIGVFELDQRETQDVKRSALKKADIDSDFITFVPVDFAQETWTERLLENGFDRTKKTLFLWEGVTLYLHEKEVKESLHNLVEITASGSVLACDLYSDGFLKTAMKAEAVLKLTNETMHFSLDLRDDAEASIDALLNEAGLTRGETLLLGSATKKGTLCALAEATIP